VTRLPLSGKILLVAALNAVLLAVLLAATGVLPWPGDFQAFVMSAAGPSVGEVSQRVSADLARTPPEAADRLLADYSREFGVTFLVYRNDGTPVAGPREITPPAAVIDRLRAGEGRFGQGRGRGGPPSRPGDGRGGRGRRGGPPPAAAPFLVRTAGNPGYWIGSWLPIPGPENGEALPGTLLIASDGFFGNPFLRRSMQWVLVALGALALSILCWTPLLRGVARSVTQLEQATARISDGRFDVRVDESRGDELGRLGSSINRMASRIDAMVTGQTRFLGDTAHELRSPLGRMQIALGLLDTRVADADQPYLQDLHEDVDQLSTLTAELLQFARTRLAPRTDPPATVQVAALVERIVKLEARPAATIDVTVPPGLAVTVYEHDLGRALGNVVRNAVRYAGESGPIHVSASRRNGDVDITVSDSGPGVPADAIDRLFEPFYRLDPSRDRKSGGAGLGLAIARSAIEACGGRIVCRNRVPSGLEVVITVPV